MLCSHSVQPFSIQFPKKGQGTLTTKAAAGRKKNPGTSSNTYKSINLLQLLLGSQSLGHEKGIGRTNTLFGTQLNRLQRRIFSPFAIQPGMLPAFAPKPATKRQELVSLLWGYLLAFQHKQAHCKPQELHADYGPCNTVSPRSAFGPSIQQEAMQEIQGIGVIPIHALPVWGTRSKSNRDSC